MSRKTPLWKVYFDGSFWSHNGRDHAGAEVPIGKTSGNWLVPSLYLCGKGLVIDICMRVPAQDIRDFMDKWELKSDDPRRFSREQRMQMDAENPLKTDFTPEITANGRPLNPHRGCAITWVPCLPDVNAVAQDAVAHYGLDPADGWVISRQSFSWPTKRRPKLRSLSLTLRPQPIAVPGPHFRVSGPGDQVSFRHPVTGETHSLIVQEYERQELKNGHFEHLQGREFPTHYTAMTYSVSPELSERLTILDCAESDPPRQTDTDGPSAAHIGIIGGADGPTAIVFGSPARLHAACSALHFEPVEDVQWRMVFYRKQNQDLKMELI